MTSSRAAIVGVIAYVNEPPKCGSGAVTSSGSYVGTTGFWYWVEIVDIAPSDRFCWAKADDDGVTWFPAGCDPPNEVLTPNEAATGTFGLDSGLQVTLIEVRRIDLLDGPE